MCPQVRLDPIYALVGEAYGPILLVARAEDVPGTLRRAVCRLGEKKYCPALNNCEVSSLARPFESMDLRLYGGIPVMFPFTFFSGVLVLAISC